MRTTALVLLVCLPLLCADSRGQEPDEKARYQRWLDQGIARHRKLGNLRRAMESLLEAIRVDPGRPEAFVQLARVAVDAREADRAVFCYYEALRRTPAKDRATVLAALKKLLPGAGLVEKGQPSSLVAHYLGRADNAVGSRGGSGSLPVGGALVRSLLLVQARTKAGQLIGSFTPRLAVSKGLKLTDGKVTGGAKPSRMEWVRLSDATGAARTSVAVSVVGKLTRLRLRAQHKQVGPGGMLHISVRAFDAAGNRLYHPAYRWRARHGEANADKLLNRTTSHGLPDFRGESQRVGFQAPAKITDPEQLGKYTVTCRHAGSGVEGSVTVELVKQPVELKYTWPPFTWSDDLESALTTAKKQGKPVLINFYADW